MSKDFEFISHTADIQICVYGKTLKELFKNALIGMFQSIGPKAPECRREQQRLVCPKLPQRHLIEVSSIDLESLLVDFLSEALYLSDINNEAYLNATVHEVDQTYIKATVHGIEISSFEVGEIKAVTYHGLNIERIEGTWQTDIVFDI